MLTYVAAGARALALSTCLAMSVEAVAQTADSSAKPAKPAGSLYLQCDGSPDNMSAGEAIVRLVAITAIVGLFAPQPETPDPTKRLFGEDGVAACGALIDSDKEKNIERRVPLILARALHRIEAKDYEGAIADVGKARQEARDSGLADNPYFERSVGVSFGRIEASARIRMGDVEGARAASLGDIDAKAYSYVPLIALLTFPEFGPPDDTELKMLSYRGHLLGSDFWRKVARLDELGRFEESAAVANGLLTDLSGSRTSGSADELAPQFLANLALANALAGHWDVAQTFADQSRERLKVLSADGKKIDNRSELIELFDFYDIMKLAKDGDMASARRSFGARSQWTAPTFGQIIELHRRLSVGITDPERMGLLARTEDAIRAERRDDALAVLLDSDKNNKTLFGHILPYVDPDVFASFSNRVWKTKGSKMLGKTQLKDSNYYAVTMGDAPMFAAVDALLLHSALQAKAHGKRGFVFSAISSDVRVGLVRFVDPTDPGVFDQRYSDADAVIADLRKVIPSPEELKARRDARRRN